MTGFCYDDESSGHRARTNDYLTTINQSAIRNAYRVSVTKTEEV